MKNILFVGAHFDDLELSMGGSVKRWTTEGKKVCSAILTTSVWESPDGKVHRSLADMERQNRASAAILGYKPFNLKVCPDFRLRYDDNIVKDLLLIIDREQIDTLVTIWPYDAHPTHQEASRIAMAATRKVPNVLTIKVSWNSVLQEYKPNFFVDIGPHLETKLKALQCYEDEYLRAGKNWERFVRSSASLYGLEGNCDAAEAFEIVKFRYT